MVCATVKSHRAQVSQTTYSRVAYRLYPHLSMTIESELAHIPPPKRPVIIPRPYHFLSPFVSLFADKQKPIGVKRILPILLREIAYATPYSIYCRNRHLATPVVFYEPHRLTDEFS